MPDDSTARDRAEKLLTNEASGRAPGLFQPGTGYGLWLEDAGFLQGQPYEIEVSPGKLVLRTV